MKSLGLGTGQYDDLNFGGVREGKGSWAETLKPYDDTSREIGLVGFDPRTLGVVFRLLDGELLHGANGFLRSIRLWSLFLMPSPLLDSLNFLFILVVRSLSLVHV